MQWTAIRLYSIIHDRINALLSPLPVHRTAGRSLISHFFLFCFIKIVTPSDVMLLQPFFCVHTKGEEHTKEGTRREMDGQIRNMLRGHHLQYAEVEELLMWATAQWLGHFWRMMFVWCLQLVWPAVLGWQRVGELLQDLFWANSHNAKNCLKAFFSCYPVTKHWRLWLYVKAVQSL